MAHSRYNPHKIIIPQNLSHYANFSQFKVYRHNNKLTPISKNLLVELMIKKLNESPDPSRSHKHICSLFSDFLNDLTQTDFTIKQTFPELHSLILQVGRTLYNKANIMTPYQIGYAWPITDDYRITKLKELKTYLTTQPQQQQQD